MTSFRITAFLVVVILGLMSLSCSNPVKLVARADHQRTLGNCEKAERLYKRAAARDSESSDAYFGFSECAAGRKDYRSALLHLLHAMELRVEFPSEWKVKRGDYSYYLSLGPGASLDDVIRLSTQAIEDASKHREEALINRASARYQRGLEEISAGNLTSSISYFDLALEDDNDLQEALWGRSEAYFQLGTHAFEKEDLKLALRYLDQALDDNPRDSRSLRLRAEAHYLLGQQKMTSDLAKARDHFLAALRDREGFVEARGALIIASIALAKARHKDGNHKDAVGLADSVLSLSPNHTEAIQIRAVSTHAQWERLDSDSKPTLLADLYKSLGNSSHLDPELVALLYSAAAETELLQANYSKAIDQANSSLLYLRASDAMRRKQVLKTRGIASYELALLVAEETGDLPRALQLLNQAVEDAPSMSLWGEVRRAEVHALSFDYESAAQHARNAYRKSDDSEINFHAGYNLARYLSIMIRAEEALAILEEFYPRAG